MPKTKRTVTVAQLTEWLCRPAGALRHHGYDQERGYALQRAIVAAGYKFAEHRSPRPGRESCRYRRGKSLVTIDFDSGFDGYEYNDANGFIAIRAR